MSRNARAVAQFQQTKLGHNASPTMVALLAKLTAIQTMLYSQAQTEYPVGSVVTVEDPTNNREPVTGTVKRVGTKNGYVSIHIENHKTGKEREFGLFAEFIYAGEAQE